MQNGFTVTIIESEASWGQKVDNIFYFKTVEAADAFVAKFNSANTSTTVPVWYMYAEEAEFSRRIPDDAKWSDVKAVDF